MKEKHSLPQTTPTYIDSHCPYLLFGETSSHLTSKWRGTFQKKINVENSIKSEMKYEKNESTPPPPPGILFWTPFLMLEIA